MRNISLGSNGHNFIRVIYGLSMKMFTFLYKVEGGWRVLGVMTEKSAMALAYKKTLQIRKLNYTETIRKKGRIYAKFTI